MWGLLSVSCILTTVSISFSLPFHIVDVSQSELENKSVFVNEIQLFGYDGVHKSSESSPLEFSQIEIKYSSSCLAFQYKDHVSAQVLSNQVFLTLVLLCSNPTGLSSDWTV